MEPREREGISQPPSKVGQGPGKGLYWFSAGVLATVAALWAWTIFADSRLGLTFFPPKTHDDVEGLIAHASTSREARRSVDGIAGAYLQGKVFDISSSTENYLFASVCYQRLASDPDGNPLDAELADAFAAAAFGAATNRSEFEQSVVIYANVLGRRNQFELAERTLHQVLTRFPHDAERDRTIRLAKEAIALGKAGKHLR